MFLKSTLCFCCFTILSTAAFADEPLANFDVTYKISAYKSDYFGTLNLVEELYSRDCKITAVDGVGSINCSWLYLPQIPSSAEDKPDAMFRVDIEMMDSGLAKTRIGVADLTDGLPMMAARNMATVYYIEQGGSRLFAMSVGSPLEEGVKKQYVIKIEVLTVKL